MTSEVRLRLVVRGRVQGVGFRDAARDAAAEIGVAGWVRNLPDGTVEIVAQGSAAAVERMASWARRGPRFASVDGVDVQELTPRAAEPGFRIRQ